ncbi:4-hydroxythreonine-4-phosphate dehydrogenase PdxA [Wenzhouxiangella sp. AB-CW3]|uniref:4-hydroxythreonine-4-phosphate dehydrogenase PdxA n=1 Tax=Wenzhouxiangella sp. AB-CW3 TaxID=2771012 RepID=UPI00168AFB5A|nr:4-hydroxythreonine-4-phosphate dehydrogenase PdxA [Wenzhouxiangella sp. AB-CW3]QOC22929.1 4-hydroxythreonine-4-phosphate dehydrogenase PdxA [Wenzhouxiangella sp. AB-CW3]
MPASLLLTPGEPAGIGPELAVRAAAEDPAIVLVADPGLLSRAAARIDLDADIVELSDVSADAIGGIRCLPVTMGAPEQPGQLDPNNSAYVLECLHTAARECLEQRAGGLVTGPVHKGVINAAGIAFSGHTEYLAAQAGVDDVVMMLAAGRVRVALVTTHLPLKDVPAAITARRVRRTLELLHGELLARFGIQEPRIAVLGLNPHAGEGGHLGDEEIEIIEPVLEQARAAGMQISGPLPADTAFVPTQLRQHDAVVAMYHDQGLPVLKHVGFGHAVNVTLGLPFVRTSVDHGTALDLAGTGRADGGSLSSAVALARQLMAPGP